MKACSQDEAHAFLRQSNTLIRVSSYDQEGIQILSPREVSGQEVRLYVLQLERVLMRLSLALLEALKIADKS